MNFYEKNLRGIVESEAAFKSMKPTYIGRACYMTLSGNRRACLQFTTGMYANHYCILMVSILDTRNGAIGRIKLRFEDYFSTIDTPCYPRVPQFATDWGTPQWYGIPRPSEIAALAKAAYEYIQVFA